MTGSFNAIFYKKHWTCESIRQSRTYYFYMFLYCKISSVRWVVLYRSLFYLKITRELTDKTKTTLLINLSSKIAIGGLTFRLGKKLIQWNKTSLWPWTCRSIKTEASSVLSITMNHPEQIGRAIENHFIPVTSWNLTMSCHISI